MLVLVGNCPSYPSCPGFPVCPDDHDRHDYSDNNNHDNHDEHDVHGDHEHQLTLSRVAPSAVSKGWGGLIGPPHVSKGVGVVLVSNFSCSLRSDQD